MAQLSCMQLNIQQKSSSTTSTESVNTQLNNLFLLIRAQLIVEWHIKGALGLFMGRQHNTRPFLCVGDCYVCSMWAGVRGDQRLWSQLSGLDFGACDLDDVRGTLGLTNRVQRRWFTRGQGAELNHGPIEECRHKGLRRWITVVRVQELELRVRGIQQYILYT